MISTREIKLIRSLAIKKHRDKTGLFIVEGEKMVKEALNSDFETVSLFHIEDIGEEAMSRITHLSSPSSVLAIVRQRPISSTTKIDNKKLYLALDSIRDPGNMGTILRVADWFGIDGILASEDTVDIYNPKVIQSSMGSIFRISICYARLEELLSSIKGFLPIYGMALGGDNIYSAHIYNDSGIIVMGNESCGISSDISKLLDKRFTIPQFKSSGAESLNVAVATAIACSEFRRNVIS